MSTRIQRQHRTAQFIVAFIAMSLLSTACGTDEGDPDAKPTGATDATSVASTVGDAASPPVAIEGASDRLEASTGQMIRLLSGTRFNPGPEVSVSVGGDGFIVFDLADENVAASEIPFEVTESRFEGTNPLGDYVLRSSDLAGSITDVTKSDDSGARSSFVSGSFVVTGFFVREITSGEFAGLSLFTHDPVVFSGPVTGLPFPEGTTFVSPEPLDVFVTVDGEDILVAVSTDRTVTIIGPP